MININICSKCGNTKFRITNTRHRGNTVRRYRICQGCKTSYYTYEISKEDYNRLVNEIDKKKELA